MALRRTYDETLRVYVPARLAAGVAVDTDGPLIRLTEDAGFVTYRSVGDLAPADLDALIARTRDHYAERRNRRRSSWAWRRRWPTLGRRCRPAYGCAR
jgi:hypothetical protein